MNGLMIPTNPPVRPPSYWIDRFEHWRRPASDTEEAQIERTARMIREAVAARSGLLAGCKIFGKGSYRQNTNVRAGSDMDICLLSPSIVMRSDWGVTCSDAELGLVSTPGGSTNIDAYRILKAELTAALSAAFGHAQVRRGNKAVAVHANAGTRVDADVVPAMTLWNIWPRTHWQSPWTPTYHEGIIIFADDGSAIINYPDQCYRKGVEKNLLTFRRYKRVVRILKRLRAEMLVAHKFSLLFPAPPSFLIESLVYNVPDAMFVAPDDLHQVVVGVLAWIRDATSDHADLSRLNEVNGIKPLFADAGSYKQPWSRWQANIFADSALRWLGA